MEAIAVFVFLNGAGQPVGSPERMPKQAYELCQEIADDPQRQERYVRIYQREHPTVRSMRVSCLIQNR